MAQRPVFIPLPSKELGVLEVIVEFHWSAGMAIVQKQRNVRAIHDAAKKLGFKNLLEVSTRSEINIGKALSAFNLRLHVERMESMSVETAFQGGKVFEEGGPFTDLYLADPRLAKRDPRLRNSGRLTAFSFQNELWPLEPKTAFYDWLYVTALHQNPSLASRILKYDGFTDIEFNSRKSFSTQARSCALYVTLQRSGKFEEALASKDAFLRYVRMAYSAQDLEEPRLL